MTSRPSRAVTHTSNSSIRTASTVASSPLDSVHTVRVHRKPPSSPNPLYLPELSCKDRYYRAAIVSGAGGSSWEMPTEYTECELVGKGSYGEVVRASFGEKQVAIKKVEILEDDNSGDWENGLRLLREVFFLRNLEHPHISRLVGLFPNNPLAGGGTFRYLHIVTEYCDQGSLNQHNVKSVEEALSIQIQILAGLEYLHSHHILHRDIKRENVFIRSDGHVVIGDFGLSRGFSSKMTSEVVTKPYRCMSLLLGRTYYGPEIDIYAAGIVFLEMLFCKRNGTLLPNKKTAFKTFLKYQMVLGRDALFSHIPPDLSLLAEAMHVDLEELFLSSDESLTEWSRKVWAAVPTGAIQKFAQSMVTLNYRKRPSAAELRAKAGAAINHERVREVSSTVRVPVENFDESISVLGSDESRGLAVKRGIWKIVGDVHPEWQRHGFGVWFPGEGEPEEPVSKRTRSALAKR